jgi:hypothetical protein
MSTYKQSAIHFHLEEIQEDIPGFPMANAEPGNYYWMLTRAVTYSDKPDFFMYIERLSNTYFAQAKIFPNCVYQFLIVLHKNLTAELYINEFPVAIECMIKRDVEKIERLTQNDIADIRRIKFPNITIDNTDKVVYCFKVHWKFGLFFDFTRELDIEAMALALGSLYRFLTFQYVYDVVSTEIQFSEMMKDGWFPFIEIIGNEYQQIAEAYKNKFHFEERINKIAESFSSVRFDTIKNKWWKNHIYTDKKVLLEAGISAYLTNSSEGYISCIKILTGEIEGVLRMQYFSDTKKGNDVGVRELMRYLIEKGKQKTGSNDSLFLPSQFLEYLNNVFFANFNLENGKVDLSRHSASHGVAKAEDYTKIKALQSILILDQIFFYIN